MAHHQALILLSINNLVNDNILQKRFMKNPEIQAVDILLQERMPSDMLITKEKKEKTKRIKYAGYDNYIERKYTNPSEFLKNCNVLSSENYLIVTDDKGEGYSKYKDILINKYKETGDSRNHGIFFYLRNTKTGETWKANYENTQNKEEKYEVTFTEDMSKFTKTKNKIETELKIIPGSVLGTEIRSLKIKNKSNEDVNLDVTEYFKPVLSKMEDDIAHPAFNNLFLNYSLSNSNDLIIKRNKRGNIREMYLGTNLFVENMEKGKVQYEIGDTDVEEKIKTGEEFSSKMGLVTEPCATLKRNIKVNSGEDVTVNAIISVSDSLDEVLEALNYYRIAENVKQEFNVAKAKAEEEARYLNLSKNDIETFNKILPYIVYNSPTKSLYMDKFRNKEYKQSDFWKYGISGDIPIILVLTENANDIYAVKEILKVHENLRVKGIYADLCILDYEKNIYEQYVKEQIIQEILNLQIGYLQNISGGIFLLNANEIEDEDLFFVRANIIINCSKGSVKEVIKEIEDELKKQIKNIPKEKKREEIKEIPNSITPNINMESLKFYNGFGGFSDDGREYIIRQNKVNPLTLAWSNILANENFGSIITNNMGGFTYYKNSRLNRITAWANSPSFDIPSEVIYLKDLNFDNIWTLNANVMPDDEDYYMTYGFGYVKAYHASLGLIQEADIFVPKEGNIKVNVIRLKNTLSEKRKLKLVYYLKPVLGEDEIKTNGYIDLKFDDVKNIIFAKKIYGDSLSKTVYVSSSEKISSYTGNNLSFIGNGNLQNPEGVYKTDLSMENSLGNSSCIAIELELELEAYEDKSVVLMLGEEDDESNIEKCIERFKRSDLAYDELRLTKEHWNNILRTVQIKTGQDDIDFMLNGWCMYQTIVSRMYARSAYYQSGGAYGFRDQLQDSMACKYVSEDMLKNQIIKHAMHQFEEGDALHWWHDETKRGIRTRFSDDFLWLVYAVCEYIEFTGNFGFLDYEVPYKIGNLLEAEEDERYDLYETGELKESIYKHCIRAIEKSLDFGENGLPKIGSRRLE